MAKRVAKFEIKLTKINASTSTKIGKIFNVIKMLNYVRLKKKNEVVICSEPILSLFLFILTSCKVYRYVQADDYCIYDDKFLIKNKYLLSLYKLFTKWSYSLKINYLFNSQYSYQRFLKVSKRQDVSFQVVHPSTD